MTRLNKNVYTRRKQQSNSIDIHTHNIHICKNGRREVLLEVDQVEVNKIIINNDRRKNEEKPIVIQ